MSSYNNDPFRPVEGVETSTTTYRNDAALDSDTTAADRAKEAADRAKEAAKDAAASVKGPATDVKDVAASAGQDVLATAKAEGAQVVDEAKAQGRRLLDESLGELRTQASTVQARLADTVQALSDELRVMASSPDANGPVAQFATTGQQYGDRAANWLRENDLDTAVFEVRRYAARNPWTFLAIAGGAGLLVGRLARGLKDADEPRALTMRPQDRGYQAYSDGVGHLPQGGQVSQGQGYAPSQNLAGTANVAGHGDTFINTTSEVADPAVGDTHDWGKNA